MKEILREQLQRVKQQTDEEPEKSVEAIKRAVRAGC